jgi:iron complex transport system ATP-binding protein
LAIIEINNLLFDYDDISNVNSFSLTLEKLEINEGFFTSLIGPNGCGKSTVLKLISKIIKPKKGRIKFSGVDISEIPYKEYAKLIAYVPQSTFSYFPFSVYEIVMMGRTPYLGMLSFENSYDKQIVDEAMDRLEISHLKSKGINEISGGEAQRVYIARALAQKPKLVLLDEPNSHLDIEHQIQIFELLTRLKREENLTILSVFHDLNLIGIYSEKILLMNRGELIMSGSTNDVLTEKNIEDIFNVKVKILASKTSNLYNILINPV